MTAMAMTAMTAMTAMAHIIRRFYYDMLQSATQGIVAMVTSLSPSALAALAGVSHTLH